MEITKEIREGKEIYAQRKNYENAELAVLNGATEEQAQAIVRLCGDRHYIHRNRSSVFHAESGDAETKTEEVMEQFDKDIIKYIQDFDDKYNTHFTPTLAGRMKGYEF